MTGHRTTNRLAIVLDQPLFRHDGALWLHTSVGRVIDGLARRWESVRLCAPCNDAPPDRWRDYRLTANNIVLVPQPYWKSSIQAVRHPLQIVYAYWLACRQSEALFIRGMCPFVLWLYIWAAFRRCRVCHWIVGNPVACLRSNPRRGVVLDGLSIAYAWANGVEARIGRRLTNGTFLCNGTELSRLFRSPRTVTTVSSTVMEEEFYERQDTCQREFLRILYVGFIRPEKGVEYLLEAVARLKTERCWGLMIVGPRDDHPDYVAKLDHLADSVGISDRIRWLGYLSHGPRMLSCFREADLLVLPSLSEGTPHVLAEARANSIPVVATNVGGIPSSVTDGIDGLLVPPRDSEAIERAIERIITDCELRRRMIRAGRERVQHMTLSSFLDNVHELLGKGTRSCHRLPD